MIKVSIIVPTYNRSKYLKETIESILIQDYTDYEIIITDNDSTDDTSKVVSSFHDKRIVYVKNPINVGSVPNYNVALRLAKGELIHLFSDDDIMLPNCLSKKVAVFAKNPNVGIIHSDIKVIDGDGNLKSEDHYAFKVYRKWGKLHELGGEFDNRMYHKLLTADNFICMPAVMLRKSVMEKLGLFDEHLSYIVDWQYWLKASLFYNFYYINKKLISYRSHANNTAKQISLKILEKELSHIRLEIKKEYGEHLIVKNRFEEFLIKMYYKFNHRHFYTYYIRYFIETLYKGRYIESIGKQIFRSKKFIKNNDSNANS